MIKNICFAILFLPIFTMFAQSLPSENPESYGFNYFPFNENRILVFNSDFGETISTVKKEGDYFIISNEGDNFKYIQKFEKLNNGIYIVNTEQYVDVLLVLSSEAKISYTEPALNIPMPLTKESKWEWNGFQYDEGDTNKVNIKGSVLGEEELKLEAGSFNTLKIQLNVEIDNGSKSKVTEWLAKDLGIIKINAVVEGKGVIGLVTSLLGYDELNFELKEIKN